MRHVVLLCAFVSGLVAQPLDLFRAGEGGYTTYRIPGLVTLRDGTMLAYAEARRDGVGDWADIDILLRRSRDGGRTWGPPQPIADAGQATVNNVVAIPGRGAREVHLLYCIDYARAYYRRSTDAGRSFSEPIEITPVFEHFRPEYNWNVIATGPGHGIRLRTGRLLVPVWLSTGGRSHRPSVIATIYSDDDGRTWQAGEIVRGGLENPSETLAVELSDGRVMLNARSESAALRRAVVVGPDGAGRWSEPRFDPALREPVCMASLVRHPRGKRPLVFVNPDHIDADAATRRNRMSARRNLTVKLSYDDGATWPVSQVLDPGVAGYSDVAVAKDGSVLVLYERGGVKGNGFYTAALTVLRVDVAAVETAALQR